jgi:DUF4097 and DUF4098 domain-containing protein YvlB
MTWLYSILFAGLFVASDSQPVTIQVDQTDLSADTIISAKFDESEKFEQSYPLNANGRVSVSNINGSIIIEAWDKNEVRLEATKFADTKEALAEMELDITSTSDRFSVEVDYLKKNYGDHKQWGRKRMEVQFRLSVPRTAVLDEIEAVNGSVTVSNFTNITKISAVNGEVTATNLRGTANLSTVNGTVQCDFDRLDGSSKVNLSTVNGQVNLSLPSDINATVKADTLNGNITNGFGLRVKKGEYVGRDLYGRIGSGEAQIKLDSVNGQLAVNRKNDGKSPNPVTDLLPEKTSNRDDDVSMNRNIDRSIDQAVRASQKEAQAAMRAAQREIEKIRPEMDKIKIKELENLKIDINTKEIEKGMREAMRAQADAMVRMRDAMWMPGLPSIVKQSKSFPVRGVPTVTINANGCNVTVRGWDNPEVKYSLTEISRGRESSKASVSDSASDSQVTIRVVDTDGHADGWSGVNNRIEVFVPRKSNIKVVTDGEIRVSGISGEVDVTGADEAIDFREIDGELKVTAGEGQVRVVGFKGDLISQTADGPVFLEGDFKSIKSHSADGAIILTLPSTANATVSSNGNIQSERTDGVREKNGNWRFGTGGSTFDFNVVDGSVVVRDRASIETK